jgi:hypothetical protein
MKDFSNLRKVKSLESSFLLMCKNLYLHKIGKEKIQPRLKISILGRLHEILLERKRDARLK